MTRDSHHSGAFLSAAPPTPNGNLHLGHLSGPYIAADVYRRYLALREVSVALVSGSDDNQSYVAVKGDKMGIPPTAVSERFGDSIHSTLTSAGIQFDYYLRPKRTPEYVRFVQDFFQTLVESGHVAAKEADSFYCDSCRRYLFEAYAGGECPHCHAETNGHGCEDCGFYNDAIDLLKPECNQCLGAPSLRRIKKFYFTLEAHRDALIAFLSRTTLSPSLREFTSKLLAKPLPEVSASFIADWGIPVPIAGYEDQVIYEWLEMAAGYLYMARQLEGKIDGNPFNESKIEITQFFGFDNSFFYTAFIPALLLAYNAETRLPTALLSNQYLQLEGSKFSTSLGHAIWADEMLAAVPSDVVRFCLMHQRPERGHANFTLTDCQQLIQSQLVDRWEEWLKSLSERARALSFPLRKPKLESHRHLVFYERLQQLRQGVEKDYSPSRFSMNQVCRTLCQIVDLAREFSENPMKGLSEDAIALELMAAKALAIVASPILIDFSHSLWLALGETSEMAWEDAMSFPTGGIRSSLIHQQVFSQAATALTTFEESYLARRIMCCI